MATTQTPERRGVRWAFDVANSPFGGTAEPSTPETSTSSLAYVNSQIIAHGFARMPLDLSELGREEQNRVVKCVLGMLSQRVDDMSRAEDLSSRLRTVSYEHERLSNMLRAAKNEVLQAEREAEAAKTKANSLIKDLSAASTSHNRTSTQLAQSTSAVAALRAASTADTRKREQDVARLKERWQRLAAEQAKLGTVGSGMVCSNWAVAVNEQYVGMRAEGEEAAEGAMRDAIEARERLAETNDEFREVLVKGLREKEVPEVKLPTPASLFTPPAIEDDAGPALNAYRALRDLIQQLASAGSTHSPDKEIAAREAERAKQEQHRLEIRGWEEKVEKLEREMAKLKGELAASNDFCEKSRLLIAQMVNDKKEQEKNVEEHNVGEANTLIEQRQQLEEERAKFTDAAIRLARERSDFEVERLALAEEKRQWATRRLEEPAPPAPGPIITITVPESDAPSSPIPTHDSDHLTQPLTDTEDDPTPAENTLAGQLRMALKAAKAAESGERTKKKSKTVAKKDKPKPKDKPKTKEKEKPAVKDKPQAKDKPQDAEKENVASGSGVPDPFRPAPKIPTTPRSLHPAAQRARARNYAPAVPSPLSRIISMAVSPEKNEVEGVVQLPSKMTMTLRSSTSGKKSGSRSPKAGSSRSPTAGGSGSPPRATGSVGGGSLAEKFAAAAAKDRSKVGKGKGKEKEPDVEERTKIEQEQEKEEGRDLDVIFAAPKDKKKKSAGPSRAGGSKVPVAAGKPLRIPVVAKRALTPRKAPLGGVRAKRSGWKG
ncbi:Afadin and alpha-actinin-binding-domain-containing protein [Rhizoctonia solani]|nr:Afadin and alpha-actinin-binding-domain-containing protein [Rhizoctonia solani]